MYLLGIVCHCLEVWSYSLQDDDKLQNRVNPRKLKYEVRLEFFSVGDEETNQTFLNNNLT